MTIIDCIAEEAGKFICQNGGTTFQCTWYLYNVDLNSMNNCVAMTDSSSTRLYYDGACSFVNCKTL
jgi:hypothetical protein